MRLLRIGDTIQSLLILAAVIGCLGCRQQIYNPRALPPQYMASPPVDVHALDLANLARPRAESDVVRPGDLIGVTILTGAPDEKAESWPLRVAADGSIEVPLVGQVMAAGLSLVQLEDRVRAAGVERGVYQQPTVAVTLDRRRNNRVTVVGGVKNEDTYELPANASDLLSALVAAGGLSEDADTFVEIRTPSAGPGAGVLAADAPEDFASLASFQQSAGPGIFRLNLAEATARGPAGGVKLSDGSVVMVMRRPQQYVHVMGLVAEPSQVEIPANQPLRLLDALAQAGGLSMPVANKVYIVRKPSDGHGPPIVIRSTVKEAKVEGAANVMLAAGDVVSVEQTPSTYVWSLLRQFISIGFGVSGRIP
jgi:polysaccharide export outer membrane protein